MLLHWNQGKPPLKKFRKIKKLPVRHAILCITSTLTLIIQSGWKSYPLHRKCRYHVPRRRIFTMTFLHYVSLNFFSKWFQGKKIQECGGLYINEGLNKCPLKIVSALGSQWNEYRLHTEKITTWLTGDSPLYGFTFRFFNLLLTVCLCAGFSRAAWRAVINCLIARSSKGSVGINKCQKSVSKYGDS